MAAMFARVLDLRLARYLLASIGALAVDFACYLALLQGGMHPAAAAAISYCAGIAAHWLLSSRAVFVGQLARRGSARARQKALFIGSAVVGLGLTTAIVWWAGLAAIDPRPAKVVAVGASFLATWLLRSRIVFR